MGFNLASVLKLLEAVGPVIAAAPAFKEIFEDILVTFREGDEAVLREAYADLIADNDEGHARLQEKLAAASRQ